MLNGIKKTRELLKAMEQAEKPVTNADRIRAMSDENNRGYKRKIPKWDVEKGRELWEQGYSDTQIAQVVGAKRDTVSVYRRKHWGGRNSKVILERMFFNYDD